MESRGKIHKRKTNPPGDSIMSIQLKFYRSQYRRLNRLQHKTNSKIKALRCRILILLSIGKSVNKITELTGCVRATVYRTLYRFEDMGDSSVVDQRTISTPKKVTENVKKKLIEYLDFTPPNFGWHRSSWTLELLALQIEKNTKIKISPRHVRNILRELKCRRGRPRVALRIPIRGRRKVIKSLKKLIKRASQNLKFFLLMKLM